MTCRRAYEIDIAAYLADPRAAEFADFRAHWPACAACAAEVRAWTELSASLAAGAAPAHPEPALLLRYAEAPQRLEPAQHAALRAHLAGCAACRDELVGLRAFERALEAADWKQAPTARRLALGEVLRRLFWRPAFAYAVAFAVAGPLIYLQVTQERLDLRPLPRQETAPPAASLSRREAPAPVPWPAQPPLLGSAPPAPEKREREPVAALRKAPPPKPKPEPSRSGGAGAASPAPPKPERKMPPASAPAREPAAEVAPAPSEAPATAPEAARKSLEQPSGALELRGYEGRREAAPQKGVDSEEARPERLRALGYIAEEEGAAAPAEPTRLELRADDGGEFVSVPLDPESGESVVRIESPDGEKRRVERYSAGASVAQLRLAKGWLGAGRHRIVVRSDRGEREYFVER